MAGNTVNGSGNGARSGAQTLLLLAAPLNVLLLRALAEGSKNQSELLPASGFPAQTTLRTQLKRLTEIGALEKRRRNRFPGALEYELTPAGRDLLVVADTLEEWLRHAPEGPMPLGSTPAKAAIKALADGWSTTMIRALAARPLSLTELDGVIASLSYPALERRLAGLRLAGLVEASPGGARRTPYVVTDWLRLGIAPLAAASHWERRRAPSTTPEIGPLDVEAAFLLTVPMVRSLDGLNGSCRLAVELPHGKKPRIAGVVLSVENGALRSCTTNLDGAVEAWALGSSAAWLSAVIESSADSLEVGGDGALARSLIGELHEALFRTDRVLALDSDRSIEEDRSN